MAYRDIAAPSGAHNAISRRNLVATLAAAPLAAVPVLALADEADAELLALGEEFERAWARERDAWASVANDYSAEAEAVITAASDIVHEIVRRMIGMRATTFAGFQVKARAYAWCYAGEEPEFLDDGTADMRVAGSVMRDLLAMAEARP